MESNDNSCQPSVDVEQIQQKTTTWPWCGRFSVLVFFFVLLLLASLLLLLVLLLLFFHHHYQRHFPPACRRLCRFLRDTAVVAADAAAAGALPVSVPRSSLPPPVLPPPTLWRSFQRFKRRGRLGPYLGPDEKVGFILSSR